MTTDVENGVDGGVENGAENDEAGGVEERLVSLLRIRPDIRTAEISEELGISLRTVSRIIKKLRENGKIKRIGSDKKGYWEVLK